MQKQKQKPVPRKSPSRPTRMKILGKPVEIRWTEEILEVAATLGASSSIKQTIWLSTALQPEQLADTFLHEVIHIVSDELHLGFDEDTVCRLACGLHSAGVRVLPEETL